MNQSTRNPKWSHDDTMIAFYVFCSIPFKDSSSHHPLVVEYAKLLPGRSSAALNMKIGNLGRLDPDLKKRGITGLSHGAKLEEDIWQEFGDDPDAFNQKCLSIIAKRKLEMGLSSPEDLMVYDECFAKKVGEDRVAIIKQRVNQSFFRQSVCSAYNYTCCVSQISNEKLVQACHIIPWKDDSKNRLNPKNGICLSYTMHKAYDSLLLGITPDCNIVVSDEFLEDCKDDNYIKFLLSINNTRIKMPDKFLPEPAFLDVIYQQYKNKHY